MAAFAVATGRRARDTWREGFQVARCASVRLDWGRAAASAGHRPCGAVPCRAVLKAADRGRARLAGEFLVELPPGRAGRGPAALVDR